MKELWTKITNQFGVIKAAWKREPVRVLYVIAIAGVVAGVQIFADGMNVWEAIQAAWIAVIGELARSQVTPVRDPRL